jgi:hypothetical protein
MDWADNFNSPVCKCNLFYDSHIVERLAGGAYENYFVARVSCPHK